MDKKTTFRTLLTTSWLLLLVSYLIPVNTWYSDATYQLLRSYDGYGSWVNSYSTFLIYFPLWGSLIAVIGMLNFKNWGRFLYLALCVYCWLCALVFGTRIVYPVDNFLSTLLSVLDGSILTLAYMSELATEFVTPSTSNIKTNSDTKKISTDKTTAKPIIKWLIFSSVFVLTIFITIVTTSNYTIKNYRKAVSKELDSGQAMLWFNHLLQFREFEADLSKGCADEALEKVRIAIDQEKRLLASFYKENPNTWVNKYISDRDPELIDKLKTFQSKYGDTWSVPECKK